MDNLTREVILDTAKLCVCGGREEDYGSPEDNFAVIAAFWETYLNKTACPEDCYVQVSSVDVAVMLALLKIARIAGEGMKVDNWIDLAGYAACGGELQFRK